MKKAELPAPRYWDSTEYIGALFSLIHHLIDPLSKSPQKFPAPDSVLEIEAISPVRRLFIFLCAAERMAADLQGGTVSGYRVSFDLREKVSPLIEKQFALACRAMTDTDWSALGQRILTKIAEMVRFVVMVGYFEGIGLTSIYPAFWRSVTKKNPLFQDEFETVNARIEACQNSNEQTALENLQRYLWLLTESDIVRSTMDKAFADGNQIGEALTESLKVIENLMELEDFERMHDWLRWLRPHMGSAKAERNHVRKYCILWMLLATDQPVDEECLLILRAYQDEIPFQYTEYLLATNRDKEWISFHLAHAHLPIDDISKSSLKIVEKRSMHLLLPLYFQGAERYVEMKNRHSYKYAVRLLKKLASYYKKTKQPERFEAYIRDFMKRHTRLRALHEEMRKGRLIS